MTSEANLAQVRSRFLDRCSRTATARLRLSGVPGVCLRTRNEPLQAVRVLGSKRRRGRCRRALQGVPSVRLRRTFSVGHPIRRDPEKNI